MTDQIPRVIAMDLDGTLLPKSKVITGHTLSVLRACREKGCLLVFATGRTYETAKTYLDAVEPDAAVLSYGAHVIVNGGTVFRRFMSPAVANRVLRLAADAECLRLQDETGQRYTCGREEAGCLPLRPDIPVTKRIDHICAWKLPEERASSIARDTRCSLSQVCGPLWCNFSAYGCTKASGTRRAFGALGLAPGTGIAFGDEDCDIGFFNICGTGVAMANSDERTLAAARYMTGSCDEDGVAAFLERTYLNE